MLNRFLDKEGFIVIPWLDRRYLVSCEGKVIDLTAGTVHLSWEYVDGTPYVAFFDGIVPRRLKVAVLVALAFKQNRLASKYWDALDVLHVDGNIDNVHPSNLVWRYKQPIEKIRGFASIPGFSRYAINPQGQLYSFAVQRCLSPYTDEMGYWMYGVTPDVGRRTIVGMHRLLALAYLPYTASVDSSDVNHKDGRKENNRIDNLEWVDRKGNCDHAYSTGLRDDNVPVVVRNAFTGNIARYYSLEDCARHIGCDGETVRLRVRSDGQVIYPPGLQFKRENSDSLWKVFDDPAKALMRSGVAASIQVIDKMTGKIATFRSINEASVMVGVTPSCLSFRLRNSCGRFEDNAFVVQKSGLLESPRDQ